MKRFICGMIILIFLFSLVSCDRSHLCSLDVLCSDESTSIIVDGEKVNSFNFSTEGLNHQPLEKYSNIDFTSNEKTSNANIYKFEIASLENDTYALSLKLVDDNKYVTDYLRVGILIGGELRVYKYYDKNENIFHKENDPESILHFSSKNEIVSGLAIDLSAGESKEIVIFVWLEESELYNKNGERYTGWEDKSYDASPIKLSLEIE